MRKPRALCYDTIHTHGMHTFLDEAAGNETCRYGESAACNWYA